MSRFIRRVPASARARCLNGSSSGCSKAVRFTALAMPMGQTRNPKCRRNICFLCQPDRRDEFRWDARGRTRHGFFHFELQGAPDEWRDTKTLAARARPRRRRYLRALVPSRFDAERARRRANRCGGVAAFGGVCRRPNAHWRGGAATRARSPSNARSRFCIAVWTKTAPTPMTLSELASAACVTPEHLCRLFKSATGLTPIPNRQARAFRPRGHVAGPLQLQRRRSRAPVRVFYAVPLLAQLSRDLTASRRAGCAPRVEAGEALPQSKLLRTLKTPST